MRSDYKFIYEGFIAGAALCVFPSLANAQSKADPKSNFKFELGVGASYNSNVSVTELDNNSGANDSQASLYGLIRYDKDFGENTEFYVRYRYSQTNHSKFSRFDRQTHSLASRIVHDFGSFDAGINYSYYDAALDNDGFLSAHRFSPYIRKRFNKKVMARAFYAYSDKNFDTSIARDAHENEGGVDIYYFIDSVRQYIQTQYSYKDVNSFGPQFDYGAHKVRVRYSKRIPLNGKRLRVRGTYRFEQRNYDSVTPSILAVRDDTKHRFIVEVQYPITDKVFGELEYLHAVNNSNLPAVDYNRDLLTATISVKF